MCAQRNSEYERQVDDFYPTPIWVTQALVPHIPGYVRTVWEPAAGTGHMVEALRFLAPRLVVLASDLRGSCNIAEADFFSLSLLGVDAIITNPPFDRSDEFVRHAISVVAPRKGFVALLQRSDFDHAAGRRALFSAPFAKRIVLTKRVTWFIEPLTGRPKASPSVNHAWYIWDFRHEGAPQIAYQEAA
jgi:hypothetical protein